MKNDNERTEVKKRSERKRFLNVIYFIDSKRTRTLKFSIGTSYATVAFLSTAVVWSIISTTLLIRDYFVISGMRAHTTTLLETVFNYQTRYDEAYEKAYPANDASKLTAEKDEEKAKERAPIVSVPEIVALDKSPPASPKEKVISQAKLSTEPPLAINNFSTHLNEKNLMIRLSLKNLDATTKVSGSVKAVAKFIDSHEKAYALESHPSRTRDDNGNDEHFNIRYFKNKAFYFEPPQDTTGRFVDVVVTIKDDSGRSKDFSYPINKEMLTREMTSGPFVKATEQPKEEEETQTDVIAPSPADSPSEDSVPTH